MILIRSYYSKLSYHMITLHIYYTCSVRNFGISKSKKKISKFFFRNFELGFEKKTKFEISEKKISKKKISNFFFEFRNLFFRNFRIMEKFRNSYSKFENFEILIRKSENFEILIRKSENFEIIIRQFDISKFLFDSLDFT